MKQNLHTLLRKVAAVLLLSAAGTLPMLAAEQADPLSIIHPEWEYTYYNQYYDYMGPFPIYQKCAFTEEKEIDGNNYWLFTLQTETDENGIPKESNIPLAYMREENGKVYMRLHPDTPAKTGYGHRDIYGHKDREILIYDFNLKVNHEYWIGEDWEYPLVKFQPEDFTRADNFRYWLMDQEKTSPYAYMIVWDNGRLSVADIKEDNTLGRRVWFIHQQCSYPDFLYWPGRDGLLDESDTDFDTTHTRTFRFVEGIGCLKSFLPFPGLLMPTFQAPQLGWDHGSSPLLCEITDKTTGEIIYKDEHRPGKDNNVDKVGADTERTASEYYNQEGIRVLNPAPGEICIVRRGAKVTKEVIGR